MKKTLLSQLFFLFIFSITICQAQFDDKFYFPSKEWKPIADLKYEEVFLDTDTIKLNGIFVKPQKKAKATILLFHGAGGNVSSYTYIAKPLVDKGFQVFMIDFRGYGKSTGKPTHVNILKDGQLVLDYLIKRNDVKGTKLILLGVSIGSQVATRLAKDNKNSVSALVLDSPLSSFTDIAAFYAPKEQQDVIKQYLVSPYSAKEDIASVEVPKLIIHSKEDKEVPFEQGQVVFNAAKDPKTFWETTGKHIDAAKVAGPEYAERIEKLLSK
ncbi:alpha/beta hydrolase [Xanthocytophaga agilis]|uniref:Alpha/beta fold hydrolase n=1 Tax=Xanthocytophaga agilis TaxID=3048010 RepID=A0AAE3UDS9_9BACT|nr:alpha/beta fold hydrolase [Xanthocytophaga agilis]MDJ1501540.1 alpha/beta fold hydrolase [Xanthocytophaga agilis]